MQDTQKRKETRSQAAWSHGGTRILAIENIKKMQTIETTANNTTSTPVDQYDEAEATESSVLCSRDPTVKHKMKLRN